MHVHANYNLQLAVMGSNRDEIHEIAARRAAEVRRRLAAISAQEAGEPDDAFIKAVSTSDATNEPSGDAYLASGGELQTTEEAFVAEREPGRHFSALA